MEHHPLPHRHLLQHLLPLLHHHQDLMLHLHPLHHHHLPLHQDQKHHLPHPLQEKGLQQVTSAFLNCELCFVLLEGETGQNNCHEKHEL